MSAYPSFRGLAACALSRALRVAGVVVLCLLFVIMLLGPPRVAWACGCGCGIFDVGTSSMFPSHNAGTIFGTFSYLDQNQNWHDTRAAPARDNGDKEIKTDFYSVGGQYMFDGGWGVMAEVPYWYRYFRSVDDDSGELTTVNRSSLGDVKVQGMYTGFSEDLSTGIRFGLKLPTGDYKYKGFDRDVSIGTGSTDVLLGGYHLGQLGDSAWSWFAQLQFQDAVATQHDYRPGNETVAAVGVYYDAGPVGLLTKLAPVLQLTSAFRDKDSGKNADPPDTGYKRIYVSPGLQFNVEPVRMYADVELPVYQWTNGNQLVAPWIVKTSVAYAF